jgi:hypothetical protein
MGDNYGGKVPDQTAYIKRFIYGAPTILWKTNQHSNIPVIMPATLKFDNVYIPGNLYVDGTIFNPSDIHLKNNISELNIDETNKLMKLKPSKFTFTNDPTNHIHYGFIAQELEIEYPELISIKPDSNYDNIKAINYLEIIPLLVSKIQTMQSEIDELKLKVK